MSATVDELSQVEYSDVCEQTVHDRCDRRGGLVAVRAVAGSDAPGAEPGDLHDVDALQVCGLEREGRKERDPLTSGDERESDLVAGVRVPRLLYGPGEGDDASEGTRSSSVFLCSDPDGVLEALDRGRDSHARRHDEPPRFVEQQRLAEPLGDGPCRGGVVLEDDQVELAAAQPPGSIDALDLVDGDLDAGRRKGEVGEHRCDDAPGDGLERTDDDASADLGAEERYLLAGLDELGLDALGRFGEHEPDRGEGHSSGPAVEDLDVLLELELGDLLRDGGRGQTEQIGRCNDSASPVDGKENTKPSGIDSHVEMLHGLKRIVQLCYMTLTATLVTSPQVTHHLGRRAAGTATSPTIPKEHVMSAAVQLALTAIGWTGAITAVIAYGLVTTKRITPDSLRFQAMNIVGAALLSVSATVYGAWPSAVVNVIWVGIGVFALRAITRSRIAAH